MLKAKLNIKLGFNTNDRQQKNFRWFNVNTESSIFDIQQWDLMLNIPGISSGLRNKNMF